MIKIFKITPITIDGEDCLEVMIRDTHFSALDNCEACIYRDQQFSDEEYYSCFEIHGCLSDPSVRFIRLPLDCNIQC